MQVPVDAPEATMRTALHEAASAGRTECVARLVEMRADVNASSQGDWTPLHLAAMRGIVRAHLRACTWMVAWV